jgi:hypothetical protein
MTNKAGQRLYLLLDSIYLADTHGLKTRVWGPFRMVQFAPDGIRVSAGLLQSEHLATVNEAGRYVLQDGTEWHGARVLLTAGMIDPEEPARGEEGREETEREVNVASTNAAAHDAEFDTQGNCR